MDPNYKQEFSQCPNCHSEERFFETLGKEAVASGMVSPTFNFALDAKNGVVQEQNQHHTVGEELIGWSFKTDICTGCGVIYAAGLQRSIVKVQNPPPKIVIPQLVQKKDDGNGEGPPRISLRNRTLN